MKVHRSAREVLEEMEYLLAAPPRLDTRGRGSAAKSGRAPRPLPGQESPLDGVAALLVAHRDYHHVAVYVNGGGRLVRLAAAGAKAECGIMDFGQGVVGKVAESGRERVVPDVNADPDYYKVLAETRSELVVPAKIGSHVHAVIDAESTRRAAFAYQDEVLLRRTAERIATFLTGEGKYLMLEARETVADHLKPRFQAHSRATSAKTGQTRGTFSQAAGEKAHS